MKKELEAYLNSYLSIDRSFSGEVSYKRSYMPNAEYMVESIDSYIDKNKDDNKFQKLLFKYIDDKGLKDSDVYNKVNIDRRLFSKIRSNKDYHPSKETIILFGLALELSEKEIEDLLKLASYSLPMNNNFDLIIRFCFKEKIYDVNTINEFLYEHNCKLLNE